METDAGRCAADVAARQKAWRAMPQATRRRIVRRAVKEFAEWVKRRSGAVVQKA